MLSVIANARLVGGGLSSTSANGKLPLHCLLGAGGCSTYWGVSHVATETLSIENDMLATLLSDENYWPTEPRSIKETGLPISMIESLVFKCLALHGTRGGRSVAESIGLPFGLLEEVLSAMRTRQLLVHAGSAPFNDYYYSLTEQGNRAAQAASRANAYLGPAPVPLMDYILSVEAQSITSESHGKRELEEAFEGITFDEELLGLIGPALNSGAGMFIYGAPGNGKSTLAKRLTACFGQAIWIPHAIHEGGQIIKLFDPSYHEPMKQRSTGLLKTQDYDRRWIRIRRPTVMVGGELTMDSLEIRYDARANISEAPLQLKSNGGCLLIDDFGRQRVAPRELLNRWIVPLENRQDFLTLGSGKKIQVPFDQLILFSTNLEPEELVDEAFMRRIPYKIEVGDPSPSEFRELFRLYSKQEGCQFEIDAVNHLLNTHYRPQNRPLRRCHPRDLIKQVRNYCAYHNLPLAMRPEYFDLVVGSYFAKVLEKKETLDGN